MKKIIDMSVLSTPEDAALVNSWVAMSVVRGRNGFELMDAIVWTDDGDPRAKAKEYGLLEIGEYFGGMNLGETINHMIVKLDRFAMDNNLQVTGRFRNHGGPTYVLTTEEYPYLREVGAIPLITRILRMLISATAA